MHEVKEHLEVWEGWHQLSTKWVGVTLREAGISSHVMLLKVGSRLVNWGEDKLPHEEVSGAG